MEIDELQAIKGLIIICKNFLPFYLFRTITNNILFKILNIFTPDTYQHSEK